MPSFDPERDYQPRTLPAKSDIPAPTPDSPLRVSFFPSLSRRVGFCLQTSVLRNSSGSGDIVQGPLDQE